MPPRSIASLRRRSAALSRTTNCRFVPPFLIPPEQHRWSSGAKAKHHPVRGLVLQPGFMLAGSLEPVGSTCSLLMASAPDGPAQDGGGSGWMLPDEVPEQTPHLGH